MQNQNYSPGLLSLLVHKDQVRLTTFLYPQFYDTLLYFLFCASQHSVFVRNCLHVCAKKYN